MQNLELITKRQENPEIQCDTEKSLFTNIFGIVKSLGLFKPKYVVSRTSRGIKISKKTTNNSRTIYVLTILDFEPPIQVSWTKAMSLSQIIELIRKITNTDKSISYINQFNISSQTEDTNIGSRNGTLYQIAIVG